MTIGIVEVACLAGRVVVGPWDRMTSTLRCTISAISAGSGRADALFVLRGPVLNSQRRQVVQLAAKYRMQAAYPTSEFAEAGGLMSYDANSVDLARRAAIYVDKILKGAKPADIPVEQPTKFEFIINLKAAKQIGLTIPPNVLARADRVIR